MRRLPTTSTGISRSLKSGAVMPLPRMLASPRSVATAPAIRAPAPRSHSDDRPGVQDRVHPDRGTRVRDRKSTRLNSSHVAISYAVFCLKKKKNTRNKLNFRKKKKKITNKN